MLSNHVIVYCSLFLLPSVFSSISVFPMSQLFPSGDRRIGVSASTSVLPMKIQGWFLLGLTGLISLQFKGLSRIFSRTTVKEHQFFGAEPSLRFNPHIHIWLLEKTWLWLYGPLSVKWFQLVIHLAQHLHDANTHDWDGILVIGLETLPQAPQLFLTGKQNRSPPQLSLGLGTQFQWTRAKQSALWPSLLGVLWFQLQVWARQEVMVDT